MKTYSTDQIRNVILVGHGGSGKTTLAEALLARAGAINRIGRVEDGTTASDTEPEEQKRGISISLAVLPFEWSGHKVNLIDTPGYADFVGDVEAALRVADLAVFVVSAVEGVEVQAEVVWRRCAELGVPRMVFVNKLDRERADFERTLEQLRDTFGAGIAPLELPIGREAGFRGVADLLTDAAFIYAADGTHTTEEIPEDLAELEHQVHDNLVEGIVVADDDLHGALPRGRGARASPSWSTRWPTAWPTPPCSRSCAARPSPASASTAWPTSCARSAPPPSTARRWPCRPATPRPR